MSTLPKLWRTVLHTMWRTFCLLPLRAPVLVSARRRAAAAWLVSGDPAVRRWRCWAGAGPLVLVLPALLSNLLSRRAWLAWRARSTVRTAPVVDWMEPGPQDGRTVPLAHG